MDKEYRNWLEECKRKQRRSAIIIGSIVYASTLVIVFLVIR